MTQEMIQEEIKRARIPGLRDRNGPSEGMKVDDRLMVLARLASGQYWFTYSTVHKKSTLKVKNACVRDFYVLRSHLNSTRSVPFTLS